jgi:integrase/recombinase XerD
VLNPDLVRVTGPLSRSREGFGAWLETVGYSGRMRAVHLRLMADLSRWLGERGETSADLGTPLLAEFIAGRRAAGHRTGLSMLALRPLTEYLRETGAVPQEKPAHRGVIAADRPGSGNDMAGTSLRPRPR